MLKGRVLDCKYRCIPVCVLELSKMLYTLAFCFRQEFVQLSVLVKITGCQSKFLGFFVFCCKY